MKRLLALIVVLLISTLLFSKGELIHETQHFRIIYSEDTKSIANNIIEIAEEEYDRLKAFFGEDPNINIPIYIDDEVKSFNAYLSTYPSNHILYYSAYFSPSIFDGSDTIRNILRHELTHTFCNTMKGLSAKITTLFGDSYNFPFYLHFLDFITEGIAVYTESMDGKGRLNDPVYKAPLIQAKLENKKINYLDAAGSRDSYPVGTLSYLFGGAFLEWISDKYGEEKLSAFIVDISKNIISFPQNAYSKHFSSRLYDDWKAFLADIDVPQDILEPRIKDSSKYYSDMVASNDEVFAIDSYSSEIIKIDSNKAKTLFSYPYDSYSKIDTKDDKFLISYTSSELCYTALYNNKGKELKRFNGYYEGHFINDDIALIKYDDGYTYLDIVGKDTINLGYSKLVNNLFSYNDKLGFLFEDQEGQAIAIVDDAIKLYRVPKQIKIDTISSNNDILSFSYAKESELVKYGEIDINNKKLYLSDTNINGGIYNPVRVNDEIFYISKFFSSSAISYINTEDLSLKEEYKLTEETYLTADKKEVSIDKKSYNPILSIQKGQILPFAGTSSEILNYSGYGITWISSDPTEKLNFAISSGFEQNSKRLFLTLNASYNNVKASFFINEKRSLSELTYTKEFFFKSSLNKLKLQDTLSFATPSNKLSNSFYISYKDLHFKGRSRYDYSGYNIYLNLYNLSPIVGTIVYIPGIFPTEVNLSYSVKSKYVSLTTTTHLLTFEVQKSLYPLPLYITVIDLKGGVSSYIYKSNIINSYSLNLSLTLAPTIGRITKAYSKLEFIATYCTKWNFSFNFSYYY